MDHANNDAHSAYNVGNVVGGMIATGAILGYVGNVGFERTRDFVARQIDERKADLLAAGDIGVYVGSMVASLPAVAARRASHEISRAAKLGYHQIFPDTVESPFEGRQAKDALLERVYDVGERGFDQRLADEVYGGKRPSDFDTVKHEHGFRFNYTGSGQSSVDELLGSAVIHLNGETEGVFHFGTSQELRAMLHSPIFLSGFTPEKGSHIGSDEFYVAVSAKDLNVLAYELAQRFVDPSKVDGRKLRVA